MPVSATRQRRIIYNDDSDQQFTTHTDRYGVVDEQSFIDARTSPTFDTQVDTYVWCVGNGADPPWSGSQYVINPVLDSCAHATDVILEACRATGMEVWGSLRMSDLHDFSQDLDKGFDPLKSEHPEYLIGENGYRGLPPERTERWLRTALNFGLPEVRQYRLDYIERNAAAHDFDGYELDFSRFIWMFPMGRERELAPLMTDFIRQTRARLNAIGRNRGRPYTFVVHVPDSPETCLSLGEDVETWVCEGLVDILVVGMGFMPFSLQLKQWTALGERYGVPIYPSLNTRPLRRFHQTRPSGWHQYIRAAAAWWWQQGVDGVYLFNLFTHVGESGLARDAAYAPLREIGDPAALTGTDKLYGIESLGTTGMFSQASGSTHLPVPLHVHERQLPLAMGPDATDPAARFRVEALTSGGQPDTTVLMRLNHAPLQVVSTDEGYAADVPPGLMRSGRNDFAIWCSADLAETADPIIVHEVLASVEY